MTAQPPSTTAALRCARESAHETWLRAEIAAALDDPRLSLTHQEVNRHFAAKHVELLQRLAGHQSRFTDAA